MTNRQSIIVYYIVFCRNNKVETFVGMTKDLAIAHMTLIDVLSRALEHDVERCQKEIANLMSDFTKPGSVTDIIFNINEELNLQMFSAQAYNVRVD